VFCSKAAAVPIKSYSPELIVHPAFNEVDAGQLAEEVSAFAKWLPALHSVVVGPGLGRDPYLADFVAPAVITSVIEAGLNLVLDADGLNVLTRHPSLLQSYNKAILTPNIVEFKRIWTAVMGGEPPQLYYQPDSFGVSSVASTDSSVFSPIAMLAQKLGVTILIKVSSI
jgi:ATP-dependent NAD(P)H-hydrate dehydratase